MKLWYSYVVCFLWMHDVSSSHEVPAVTGNGWKAPVLTHERCSTMTVIPDEYTFNTHNAPMFLYMGNETSDVMHMAVATNQIVAPLSVHDAHDMDRLVKSVTLCIDTIQRYFNDDFGHRFDKFILITDAPMSLISYFIIKNDPRVMATVSF